MHLDPDEYDNLARLMQKRRHATRRLRNAKAKTRFGDDLALADRLARFQPHTDHIRRLNAEIDLTLHRSAA